MVENEIKIIVSADIQNATKSLEQLGKQLTNTFGSLSQGVTQPLTIINKSVEKIAKQATKKMTDLSNSFESIMFPVDEATQFDGILNRLNTERLTQMLQDTGISMGELKKHMEQEAIAFNEQGFAVDKLTGKIIALDNVVRGATKQARRFNFSFLSVLFTGMALDRVFGSLVRSQMQLWGVTEMLSAMWTVTLAPIMSVMVDLLLPLIDAFMNLPEPVQVVLGAFILLMAGIGKILIFFGNLISAMIFLTGKTYTLGGTFKVIWGAISKGAIALWGVLSSLITWVAGVFGVSFGAAIGIIIGIVAALIAIVIGAIEAWKNNFFGFKDAIIGIWEGIKTYFLGVVTFWKGIWNVMFGIFTLNGDKIKQGFGQIGEGIKNMFKGIANYLIGIFNGIVSLVLSTLAQIVRAVQWIWNKVPGHANVRWYEDIMALGKDKQLIPSFKTGGIMPYTGVAYLHAGEHIIPKNEVGKQTSVNFAPVVNITTNSNATAPDISRRVSEELNRQWAYKFKNQW